MTHKYKHEIVMVHLNSGTQKVLLTRNYASPLFNVSAKSWFDKQVRHFYPEAMRKLDETLCGYHWEIDNYVFELR